MLAAAKSALAVLAKSMYEKIFQGGLLIRTKSKTLLQIVCEINLNLRVIVKRRISTDDNLWMNS